MFVHEGSLNIRCISTNQVCPAANDVTAMQIQSGDTIKIKPGCYVRTMDHVISADESETIEIAIKTMDWAGEITDLFRYENKDAIHQAVQGLRTRYNGEFDATVLLNQLDQLDQRNQDGKQESHWRTISSDFPTMVFRKPIFRSADFSFATSPASDDPIST